MEANWQAVLDNRCAIKSLEGDGNSDYDKLNCRIGGPLEKNIFDPVNHPTSFKFRASSLAAYLAKEAISDSGIDMVVLTEEQRRSTGVLISN